MTPKEDAKRHLDIVRGFAAVCPIFDDEVFRLEDEYKQLYPEEPGESEEHGDTKNECDDRG